MTRFPLFILACVFSFSLLQNAASKTYPADQLPRDVQRAVTLGGYTDQNLLQSSLDGKTSGSVKIKVEIESRNQFLLYQEKLDFRLPESLSNEWSLTLTNSPKTVSFLDPISKSFKNGYSGQNIFHLELRLKSETSQPMNIDFAFPLLVDFQACNKELCLLPITAELLVPLRKNAVAATDVLPPTWSERLGSAFVGTLKSEGIGFKIMQLLFLAGLLTAFTPCVYPLYPITLGIFVNWSRHGIPGWILGGLYSLGSVISYALLGLVAVLSGKVFGSLTQTPAFQIGIGLLIAVSAIFYSGLWDFPVPEKLRQFFSKGSGPLEEKKPKGRLAFEAFFMGLGLGIVASPCVGPVLVALMAFLSGYLAASSSAWLEGFFLFAVFGSGLMTPFLILSILANHGSRFPRLGAWLQRVKWIGSLLMLLGSLYFLVPGVKALFPKDSSQSYLFSVHEFATKPVGRRAILDFRADWCVACLELEGETFIDQRVGQRILDGWSFVKIDLSDSKSPNNQLAEHFEVFGLPAILFLNQDGIVCTDLTLSGFENADAFLRRLDRADQNCL